MEKLTDYSGKVLFPVSGKNLYNVKITKKGYEDFKHDTDVFCKKGLSCAQCKPELLVDLPEEFCNRTVVTEIRIVDEKSNPIKGANVTLTQKVTKAGFPDMMIGSSLLTNITGYVQQTIDEFGLYTATVIAKGFIGKEKIFDVKESVACEDLIIPVAIKLPPTKKHCEESHITITISDELTKKPLAGVNVKVKFQVGCLNRNY